MHRLPAENIVEILRFTQCTQIAEMRLVSRRWRNIVHVHRKWLPVPAPPVKNKCDCRYYLCLVLVCLLNIVCNLATHLRSRCHCQNTQSENMQIGQCQQLAHILDMFNWTCLVSLWHWALLLYTVYITLGMLPEPKLLARLRYRHPRAHARFRHACLGACHCLFTVLTADRLLLALLPPLHRYHGLLLPQALTRLSLHYFQPVSSLDCLLTTAFFSLIMAKLVKRMGHIVKKSAQHWWTERSKLYQSTECQTQI